MKVNDIVKLKNPTLPFQKSLRYKIVKILKTCYHLYEIETPNHIYKNVKKNLIELA